jgi:hypothetical protein
MMQILFEERVVGRYTRNVRAPREPHPRVVSNKRGVYVHKVYMTSRQSIESARQMLPPHTPIFRI